MPIINGIVVDMLPFAVPQSTIPYPNINGIPTATLENPKCFP
jgi:hypothetical protein